MSTENPDKIFDEQYKGESYSEDYELFMKKLSSQGGNMAAGEVGEMISRLAGHYMRYNSMQARANRVYTQKAQEIYSSMDGLKPITASKAEILAAATNEAAVYLEAKVHVQNIEQLINALKALQRGILNEYSHSGT